MTIILYGRALLYIWINYDLLVSGINRNRLGHIIVIGYLRIGQLLSFKFAV